MVDNHPVEIDRYVYSAIAAGMFVLFCTHITTVFNTDNQAHTCPRFQSAKKWGGTDHSAPPHSPLALRALNLSLAIRIRVAAYVP